MRMQISWNAHVIRTRVVSCGDTDSGRVMERTDTLIRVSRQIGLGLRIFETNPYFDYEEENPADQQPAWLDEYWYRRLALPSVVPQRDRILSWEPE